MPGAEFLRGFISERLTAATAEIFGVIQQTIVQYEEEINRQRKLLDVILNPEIKLHRIDLLQQYKFKVEDVLTDQLCNQKKNSVLDQTEPPQLKEEQQELCINHGEQHVVNEEADPCTGTVATDDGPEPNCDMVLSHNTPQGHHSQQHDCKEEEILSDQEEDSSLDHFEPIIQCKEKMDPKGPLLNSILTPEIRLHRIDLPQRHHCKEEEFLTDQQHCSLERNSTLNLKGSEGSSQEGQQPVLNKSDPSIVTVNEREPDIDMILSPYSPGKKSLEQKSVTYQSKRNRHPRGSGKKPFSCTTCEKCFYLAGHLTAHLRIHTGEKPFSCKTCGKRFTYKNVLNIHMRTHTGEKPFSCETCGKCFRHNYSFSVHMRTHTGERPFLCKTCGKRFSRSCDLTSHMRIHSGEKPFSCKTCGKCFTHSCNLNVHMKTHTVEKPFSCKTCGKHFSQNAYLHVHMKTHTVGKPFSCKICGKCFSQNAYLAVHMKNHTGKKPFSCMTCGKCFRHNSQLTVHMRAHTGERPFSCKTCGKCFSQSTDLTVHIRTHTGEKPFSCKKCGACFSLNSNLTVHMRTHTGEKPFSCQKCGTRFRQNRQLIQHMKTHTSEKA